MSFLGYSETDGTGLGCFSPIDHLFSQKGHLLWMDKIRFAPRKKPWNDSISLQTPTNVMVSRGWCEMDFATIHSMTGALNPSRVQISDLLVVGVVVRLQYRQPRAVAKTWGASGGASLPLSFHLVKTPGTSKIL